MKRSFNNIFLATITMILSCLSATAEDSDATTDDARLANQASRWSMSDAWFDNGGQKSYLSVLASTRQEALYRICRDGQTINLVSPSDRVVVFADNSPFGSVNDASLPPLSCVILKAKELEISSTRPRKPPGSLGYHFRGGITRLDQESMLPLRRQFLQNFALDFSNGSTDAHSTSIAVEGVQGIYQICLTSVETNPAGSRMRFRIFVDGQAVRARGMDQPFSTGNCVIVEGSDVRISPMSFPPGISSYRLRGGIWRMTDELEIETADVSD